MLDSRPHRQYGEHAARVERSILTIRQLSISTLSSLPYHLPMKYTLYLHKAVAAARNSLINVRSSPSTPDELVRGQKPTRRVFPCGACCMVTQHMDKRTALARVHQTAPNIEAKAELGVCMGPDYLTGRTLFLLANGSIVPRRPTTPFPDYFIPFDWTPKQFILRATLPPTSHPADAEASTQADAPVQPNIGVHPINTVVQLPNTPTTEAIATVTGLLPSPLPVDLFVLPTQPPDATLAVDAHH